MKWTGIVLDNSLWFLILTLILINLIFNINSLWFFQMHLLRLIPNDQQLLPRSLKAVSIMFSKVAWAAEIKLQCNQKRMTVTWVCPTSRKCKGPGAQIWQHMKQWMTRKGMKPHQIPDYMEFLTHLGTLLEIWHFLNSTLQKNVIRMDEKNMSLPGSHSFQRMWALWNQTSKIKS